MTRPPLFDSHLDLAWNAVSLNRDLTEPIDAIRARERGMNDTQSRQNATVCLPEMRRGGIVICVSTLLARANPELQSALRQDLDHRTPSIAHAVAYGQLAYYRALQRAGQMRMLTTSAELRCHLDAWLSLSDGDTKAQTLPIGHILSMEGADPITQVEELALWWSEGLRVLSLVHYGKNAYAHGTGQTGALTADGRRLLREMSQIGMILDVTHLCDASLLEALERFDGPVIATHHNCRALVAGDRQLPDELLRLLIARDAVIGCALDNWMLHPNWRLGESSRDVVSLADVADHIDHICQLAGDVEHVGIGSDLDGCFGTEQSPRDLQTIADLRRLEQILSDRGYTADDIERVFYRNWFGFFERHLPS